MGEYNISGYMPIHIGDLFYDPLKEYCGFYIVSKYVSPEMNSTSEILKIFSRRGVEVLNTSSYRRDLTVFDFVVVDLTGRKELKNELLTEIRELFGERLLSMECIESDVRGFMYNVKGFPVIIKFFGEEQRSGALTLPTWRNFFYSLIQTFSTGGFTILWFQGRGMGEWAGSDIKRLNPALTDTDKLKIALARLQALGWGKFELAEAGEKFVIRIHDNLECVATADIADYECSLTRGLFGGLFHILFEKEYICTETKCIKRGNDYCEYVLTI